MACATTDGFPRICLLADDETQGAQIVVMKDGKLIAGKFLDLIEDTFKKNDKDKPLELDAEAVAYSEADKSFYVIGSHGLPRHESGEDDKEKNAARATASRQLVRVKFDLDAVDRKTGELVGTFDKSSTRKFAEILKNDEAVGSFYDKALCENGQTIEGMAVRAESLFVGMRGPVLDSERAVILEVPIAGLFEGRPGKATPHELKVGRDSRGMARGVRELTAHRDGFLILAGPVNDPPDDRVVDGDYAIYAWGGPGQTPVERLSLSSFGLATKPEALIPLDRKSGMLRALLFFDGPVEGAPRTVEMPDP